PGVLPARRCEAGGDGMTVRPGVRLARTERAVYLARRQGRETNPQGGPRVSANPLFATKSMERLMEEMKGENRLRRVLGPVALTALGVGAIIGTGIFVLTGVAAHDKAGPALILSFVLAGFACACAGLCYSEFASMIPVAGSAYTYAYATLGEFLAWLIG